MKKMILSFMLSLLLNTLMPLTAGAWQSLGTGNGSLIGGDLTDPTETV